MGGASGISDLPQMLSISDLFVGLPLGGTPLEAKRAEGPAHGFSGQKVGLGERTTCGANRRGMVPLNVSICLHSKSSRLSKVILLCKGKEREGLGEHLNTKTANQVNREPGEMRTRGAGEVAEEEDEHGAGGCFLRS